MTYKRKSIWARFNAWCVASLQNGVKLQVALAFLTLVGVIALFLQFYSFSQTPRRDIKIQAIEVQAPLTAGQPFFVWSRTICNSSSDVIDVAFSLHLLSQQPPEREAALPGTLSASIPAHGCSSQVSQGGAVPADLEAGTWTLRVVLYYTPPGGFLRLISAESAPFDIQKGGG